MIPIKNKKNAYTFRVQDFSGGINLSRDINDHQLKNVKNMWFEKGVLTTRPGLKQHNSSGFSADKVFVDKENSALINKKIYNLETSVMGNTVRLRYVSKADTIFVGELSFMCDSVSALAFSHKGDVYLLVSATDGTEINEIYRFKKTEEDQYFCELLENDMAYAPLVLTNCWSCYNDSGKINAMINKGATHVEGFNLLSDRYRMIFSQYDATLGGYVEVVEGDKSSRVSYMEYGLPYTTSKCTGDIYLEYYCIDGELHRHKVACPKEKVPTVERETSALNAGDGLYLHAFIKGDVCHLTLNMDSRQDQYAPEIVEVYKYINNNMTVNAPRPWSSNDVKKVTSMTRSVWFGNNSLGINGGSRLFLGGGEDALVLWSDFENPLYFPENNYAYVGDKSQKITAFKRQGSGLVIFKEREIYSTTYVQGQFEEGDLATHSAYFPMVLVHPTVGCVFPESIELCRNRLVFLASDNQVKAITNQSQYSDRNVYTLSTLISPIFKGDFESAVSALWRGYYLLFVKNEVFLMDTESYGYVNISSYSRDSASSKQITWFYWRLPIKVSAAMVFDDELYLWMEDRDINIYYFSENEDKDILKDQVKSIYSLIETKHFDLSYPHDNKVIKRVNLGLIKTLPVTLEFINDMNLPDTHNAYLNSFVPFYRVVNTLGIRLTSSGKMTLTSLEIKFSKGGTYEA